jgi:hypothetical protein
MNSINQQFNFANDGLKEAMAKLNDIWHGRETEGEESQ